MSIVAIPTSSCTVSIGEPIRQPYTVLTQQQLDALDMASSIKQGEK